MKNLLYLMIFCLVGCTQRGVEGSLELFDGRPAENIELVFITNTDIKSELKLARISTTTDKSGNYRVTHMLPDKTYSMEVQDGNVPEMQVSNAPLRSIKVEIPEKGIKMVEKVKLYPVPSEYGIYYFQNSRSPGIYINQYFDKLKPITFLKFIEKGNEYQYISEDMLDKAEKIDVNSDGILIYNGPHDVLRTGYHPLVTYSLRSLNMIESAKTYEIINDRVTTIKIPKGYYVDIKDYTWFEGYNRPVDAQDPLIDIGSQNDYRYYQIDKNVSNCCFQKFSKPGHWTYYGNDGYIVKIN